MKKKLTLALALSLCLIFTLCLTGCGKASPTKVTEEFIEAALAHDYETANTLYEKGDIESFTIADMFTYYDGEPSDSDDDDDLDDGAKTGAALDKLDPLFTSAIVTVTDETINEEKGTAEVTINVTTYDFGDFYSNIYTNFLIEIFQHLFDELSDDEWDQITADIINEGLEDIGEQNHEVTGTVKLVLVDDEWKVKNLYKNKSFINAISGDACKDVEEWAEE